MFPHENKWVSLTQERGMEQEAEDVGKSKGRSVIDRIGSFDLTRNGADFQDRS